MFWVFVIIAFLIPIFGYGISALLNTKEYQDEKKTGEGFRYLGEIYGKSKLFHQYKNDRFKDVKAYLDSGYAPVIHANKYAYLVEDLHGNMISTADLPLAYEEDLNLIFGMLALDTTVYHVTMWYYFTLLKTMKDGYFGNDIMKAIGGEFHPRKAFTTYKYLIASSVERIHILNYGRRFHREPDTELSAYFKRIGLTHERLIELRRSCRLFSTDIAIHGERGSNARWVFCGQIDFEAITYWNYNFTPWAGEQHPVSGVVFMCAIIDEVARRQAISYEDAKRKVFEVALEK